MIHWVPSSNFDSESLIKKASSLDLKA